MTELFSVIFILLALVGFAMWLTGPDKLYEDEQRAWDENEDLQAAEHNVRR
jgi:hypothetical protein